VIITDRRSVGENMARIVKEHDVRKTEIIHAAEKLFAERGYDETPVEAIISEVGIAKGTFYHYFVSKEDLLDAIIFHIAEDLEEALAHVEYSEQDPVLRMRLLFEEFRILGEGKGKLTDFLHEDRNILLHWKVEQKVTPLIETALFRIVDEGNMKGIFKVEDPRIASIALLGAVSALGDLGRKHPECADRILSSAGLFERMLGAEHGMIERERKEA
jgi:AcrR family transcriptional regulator